MVDAGPVVAPRTTANIRSENRERRKYLAKRNEGTEGSIVPIEWMLQLVSSSPSESAERFAISVVDVNLERYQSVCERIRVCHVLLYISC